MLKNQSDDMLVIAGLGNPGAQYALTRHNTGFLVLDRLTVALKASLPRTRFKGEIYTASANGKKILLVRPQTFMNASGECLQEIKQFYKLSSRQFLVIYDDIDLPEGKLRLRASGGPGTHNGMRSIVSVLGEDFPRIRVGIGQPPHKEMDLADYVLGKFAPESREKMEDTFSRAADAARAVISDGIEKAMNRYNTVE